MDVPSMIASLRRGESVTFPAEADQSSFATQLDQDERLPRFRDQFIIPKKSALKAKSLKDVADFSSSNEEDAIYFCGNSLGVQSKALSTYLQSYLQTWNAIGVYGHFTDLEDSPMVAYQDMAEDVARKTAPIVGASKDEVVAMNTLTANIHLLFASFYKPTRQKHKIIIEWRPFPSDWYAVESQIEWHGLKKEDSMITISPPECSYIITTEAILKTIDEHADSTALLWLPGIQYYSGQLLDIPTITRHAQKYGITVGWDLAHAAGNVELLLHDWNVDFATWCTYKYMNGGAGSIAGAFVHERHGAVARSSDDLDKLNYRPRLTGWYGGDKSVRFKMDNSFVPTPGAAGFQLSNPSIIDLTAVSASLSVFEQTSMSALRSKSLLLTAYAEHLLARISSSLGSDSTSSGPAFRIITPSDPRQRGAQLSVLLRDGLIDHVGARLKEAGIVCDQRKPGVIRVAPAPLYNTFEDVRSFMVVFGAALHEVDGTKASTASGASSDYSE